MDGFTGVKTAAAEELPAAPGGRGLMTAVIDSISHDVPPPLVEIITLGRTLTKRAADILAFFDRPGTSNGPSEAINGRLEHLRGSALGFRNLTNYIARSLLETGGFRPQLHPQIGRAGFGSSAKAQITSPQVRAGFLQ